MGSAFSGDICARGRHDGRAKNKEEEAAVAASPGTHYHHHFAIDVDHRPERSPDPDPVLVQMRRSNARPKVHDTFVPNAEAYEFHLLLVQKQHQELDRRGAAPEPRSVAAPIRADTLEQDLRDRKKTMVTVDVGGPSVDRDIRRHAKRHSSDAHGDSDDGGGGAAAGAE